MRLNTRKTAVLVMAFMALVLSACGSDDGNTGTLRLPGTDDTVAIAATDCPDGFVVRLDDNKLNRVKSDGVQAVTNEDFREEILEFNRQDPRGLFQFHKASPLNETSPVGSVEELVEGGVVQDGACYSERGRQAYNEWSVLWKTARVQPVDSMPAGWSNTGVANGQPTSGPSPKGNTSGWMVTFIDANGTATGEHGVMKRCGNPVTPKPTAPPGPTDDKPTPGTTTTTTPRVTTTTTVPSTTTTTAPCPVQDGVQTIRGEDGVCYKPDRAHDTDGAGGDESNAAQPVRRNPPDDIEGADTDDSPPDDDRSQGDPDGGSGDAGVPDDGPVDDTREDDHTGPDNDGNDDTSTPPCPFGAGNC